MTPKLRYITGSPSRLVGPYFTIERDTSNEQHDTHTIKLCINNDKGEVETLWSKTFTTKKYAQYDFWYCDKDDLIYLRRVEGYDYKSLIVMSCSTREMIYTKYGQV